MSGTDIVMFRWRICSDDLDLTPHWLQNWTDSGLRSSLHLTGLSPQHGRLYRLEVMAVDGAGLESLPMTTDGWMVDKTAPTKGQVVHTMADCHCGYESDVKNPTLDAEGSEILRLTTVFASDPDLLQHHWTQWSDEADPESSNTTGTERQFIMSSNPSSVPNAHSIVTMGDIDDSQPVQRIVNEVVPSC